MREFHVTCNLILKLNFTCQNFMGNRNIDFPKCTHRTQKVLHANELENS